MQDYCIHNLGAASFPMEYKDNLVKRCRNVYAIPIFYDGINPNTPWV